MNARVSYVRIAPRKVRLVVDLIRGKRVEDALTILTFTRKRAAKVVKDLIQSAVANANEKGGIDVDSLYVKSISVDGGPSLKRFRPAPQGRAHPFQKRTSHINVSLAEK
jgi:large subunit ribosomal protein L22